MKNVVLFLLLCLAASVTVLPAQSTAEEMEALLDASAITYAQAARFILQASDVDIDSADAFNYAVRQKWISSRVSANDSARLDRVALLAMRSFDIEGGFFYSIFKNPHYAYHELVYKGVIQSNTDPAMKVSGGTLLYIISRIFSRNEQRY